MTSLGSIDFLLLQHFALDDHKYKGIHDGIDEREFCLPLHVIKVSNLTSNQLTAPKLSHPNLYRSIILVLASLDFLCHVRLELRGDVVDSGHDESTADEDWRSKKEYKSQCGDG